MNQSPAQGRNHRLGAVSHVESHEDDADVALDRGLGNAQLGGDLLVAPAPNNQVEDFALARAQV